MTTTRTLVAQRTLRARDLRFEPAEPGWERALLDEAPGERTTFHRAQPTSTLPASTALSRAPAFFEIVVVQGALQVTDPFGALVDVHAGSSLHGTFSDAAFADFLRAPSTFLLVRRHAAVPASARARFRTGPSSLAPPTDDVADALDDLVRCAQAYLRGELS